jgi:hypothetical protein
MTTAVRVASSGMLLLPKRDRSTASGLRAALSAARQTYRRHSAAEPAERKDSSKRQDGARGRLPALASRGRRMARRADPKPVRRDEPDVLLDVPRLHVDEIDLKIDELQARVALEARVMDLLRLDVGVDAELRGVDLTIKGVDAQALLKVRLENLTVILDRVMSTVDRNPQLLERLAEGLGATLQDVGSGAGRAVGELGEGAGSAVGDLGGAASSAADRIAGSAGAVVEDLGKGPAGDPPRNGGPVRDGSGA